MAVIGGVVAAAWLLAIVLGNWHAEAVIKVDDPIMGYIFRETDDDGR